MNLTLHYIDSIIPHFEEIQRSILASLQQQKFVLIIVPNFESQTYLEQEFQDESHSPQQRLKILTLPEYWETLNSEASWGKLPPAEQKLILKAFFQEQQKQFLNSKNLSKIHLDYERALPLLLEKTRSKKNNLSQLFEDYLQQKYQYRSYSQLIAGSQPRRASSFFKEVDLLYFLGFRRPSLDLLGCLEQLAQENFKKECHCFMPGPERWMDPEASTAWLYESVEKLAQEKIVYQKIDLSPMQLSVFAAQVHEIKSLQERRREASQDPKLELFLGPPHIFADFFELEQEAGIFSFSKAAFQKASRVWIFGLNQNLYPHYNLWLEHSPVLNSIDQHWQKINLRQSFYHTQKSLQLSYAELDVTGKPSPASSFLQELNLSPEKMDPGFSQDSGRHPYFLENIEREKQRRLISNIDNGDLASLAADISPALQKRPLKTTSIDQYAQCPWIFFAKHLLKVDSIDSDQETLSSKLRGILAHRWLEKIFRQFTTDYLSKNIIPNQEAVKLVLQNARESLIQEYIDIVHRLKVSEEVFQLELNQIATDISALVQAEIEQWSQAKFRLNPQYFEWGFGQGGTEPLKLKIENGHEIAFSGTIDRIDFNPELGEFLVIDYKSSNTSQYSQSLRELRSFQLWIYAQAVRQNLLPQSHWIGSLYWDLKETKKNQGLALKSQYEKYQAQKLRTKSFVSDEEWNDWQIKIEKELQRLALQILQGNFSLNPQDCQGKKCNYYSICRYEEKSNF